MANTAKDGAHLSDAENSEKPVREQLKKASITTLPTEIAAAANATDATVSAEDAEVIAAKPDTNGSDEARGRLHRKRSFEEVEEPEAEDQHHEAPATTHTRKRSRDSTAEEYVLNNGARKVSGEKSRDDADTTIATENGTSESAAARPQSPDNAGEPKPEAAAAAVTSPKTKRSRLHSTTGTADEPTEPAPTPAEPAKAESKPTIPPTSGFANTSAASPFGALAAGSKSPPPETSSASSSAFASSGFGALAGATSSGFGAIGKSTGGFGTAGGFATGSKSPIGGTSALDTVKSSDNAAEGSKSPTTFGGALGQKSAFAAAGSTSSGFGSGTSAFGKVGSTPTPGLGFGSGGGGFASLASPIGGGLTSFASKKPNAPFGSSASSSKPAKPFGAAAGDDDENEDEADDAAEAAAGAKSPLSVGASGEEKQDERFYQQDIETGEEGETTAFSGRAKLYNFAPNADGKKEWRERGLGTLRLNVKRLAGDADDDKAKTQARFLMRAEGSHRVVLNTPVNKQLKFGNPSGGPPQSGCMFFLGTIDDSAVLEMLQLKMRHQLALDLYERVGELQDEM